MTSNSKNNFNFKKNLFSDANDRIFHVKKCFQDLSPFIENSQISCGWRNKIKKVIFLMSSSRGGSSVTSELLKHSQSFLHFQGEINPALSVVGLTPPNTNSNCDELTEHDYNEAELDGKIDLIEKILSLDIGSPLQYFSSKEEIQQYAAQILFRLCLQWPEEIFDVEWALEQSLISLDETNNILGSLINHSNILNFFILFLSRIRKRHPCIKPVYYDLNINNSYLNDNDVINCHCPPSNTIFEEPPFIIIKPFKIHEKDFYIKQLLIKTPANNYRINFWKKFFPNASYRIIHLTRHPGASINGLVDGWKHHGFHYAPVNGLSISGYSDEIPFGDIWWKFDMPPGWEERRTESLYNVASFQWSSAHKTLLNLHDVNNIPYFQIKFEDLFHTNKPSIQSINTLSKWIFDDYQLGKLAQYSLPPVMSTKPPNHDRWLKRYKEIIPYISEKEICYISRLLGYKFE
ncbi:hypothetical protein MHK_004148 [Candidatus Magnetomorum sp. HK-1]|nr:hypothetical protein MHK_004148 [Candidatus Magnetomorum sp. HK-1]